MVFKRLTIASRRSPLAVAQTDLMRGRMHAAVEDGASSTVDESFPLRTFVTTGDRVMNPSLAEIGGKGLFTKEIEAALLNGDADVAVHSMKDMPADIPPGLVIAAVPPREDPRDAFVTLDGRSLDDMPSGARIGTSSIRRGAQLRRRRSDLEVVPMRGNVGTRLEKLERGDADGTFLAEAGLRRLGANATRRHTLPLDVMLPALGQGFLCLQARAADQETLGFLARISCPDATLANAAERGLIQGLGASCKTPVAGIAAVEGDRLLLRAELLLPDGSRAIGGQREVPLGGQTFARTCAVATDAGRSLAEALIAEAGDDITTMLEGA